MNIIEMKEELETIANNLAEIYRQIDEDEINCDTDLFSYLQNEREKAEKIEQQIAQIEDNLSLKPQENRILSKKRCERILQAKKHKEFGPSREERKEAKQLIKAKRAKRFGKIK